MCRRLYPSHRASVLLHLTVEPIRCSITIRRPCRRRCQQRNAQRIEKCWQGVLRTLRDSLCPAYATRQHNLNYWQFVITRHRAGRTEAEFPDKVLRRCVTSNRRPTSMP